MLRSITDSQRFRRSFAVTSEKLQPKSNTKLVLLTNHLYVQYVGTNWTPLSLFLFFFPSGWDPSQLCPVWREKSGTLWFQDQFLVHDHYMETRGGLHVTLIQFILKKRKIWFIYSASISDFSVCILPLICPLLYFMENTLYHIKPLHHHTLCNYLKRYYLYVLYWNEK